MQQGTANLYTIEQVQKDGSHDYVLARTMDGTPMYRRVMTTDEEIYEAALEEWLGVLAQLWIAFGKALDAEQMTIYQRNLSGLPLGLLEAAVQRVIREHTYNSVPTLAEVWGAVRTELQHPWDLDQAIRNWEQQSWERAAVSLGVSAETEVA